MQDPARTPTTRLAPSPTGALHLGNARTFLINYALARRLGWKILLRIEDLDTPRIKPGVIDQTIETLHWLGLDWDERVPDQTDDLELYRDAMRTLASQGSVFPCGLTRREIAEAAAGPIADEHEDRFPLELRPSEFPSTFDDPVSNWRFVVPPDSVLVADEFAGQRTVDVASSVGDFVVWTQRGTPSYQLAVVVDDLRQGVTHIVRGDDLLSSAARQTLLRDSLGHSDEPVTYHVPLVRGSDGKRLAKRHGDTRLTTYRDRGVPAERVVGLIAGWCGMTREPMSTKDFAARFELGTMPRTDITFTPEDETWLLD